MSEISTISSLWFFCASYQKKSVFLTIPLDSPHKITPYVGYTNKLVPWFKSCFLPKQLCFSRWKCFFRHILASDDTDGHATESHAEVITWVVSCSRNYISWTTVEENGGTQLTQPDISPSRSRLDVERNGCGCGAWLSQIWGAKSQQFLYF